MGISMTRGRAACLPMTTRVLISVPMGVGRVWSWAALNMSPEKSGKRLGLPRGRWRTFPSWARRAFSCWLYSPIREMAETNSHRFSV